MLKENIQEVEGLGPPLTTSIYACWDIFVLNSTLVNGLWYNLNMFPFTKKDLLIIDCFYPNCLILKYFLYFISPKPPSS